MPKENSFDISCEPNLQELDNALNQLTKEVANRFDFKGSEAAVLRDDMKLKLGAENELRMRNLRDMLEEKMIKRGVSIQFLSYGDEEEALGGKRKQEAVIQKGIPTDQAKTIVKFIKEKKFKVQASIQSELVRVTGKDRDELQAVMAAVRGHHFGLPLSFGNYR